MHARRHLGMRSRTVVRADSIVGEKTIDQPITLPSETSSAQLLDQPLLDVVTPVEDIGLVEDASDDEEAVSQVIVEDPIYLITIEDDLAHSTTKEDDFAHSTTEVTAPSPPAKTARRRCKSHDMSSLRRSTRLAQRNVLKDLGIVEKDGKLDDDAIQEVVGCLKDLMPPDLLKPLMELKGCAFSRCLLSCLSCSVLFSVILLSLSFIFFLI